MRVTKGKTYEEIFGLEKGKKLRIQRGLESTGRKRSFKTKQKMSKKKRLRDIRRPGEFANENNPNWRGGISNLPYPLGFNSELKEKIRQRDGRCLFPKCNVLIGYSDGRNPPIHHIDYNKTNISELNLIQLCAKHHQKINFYRKIYQLFFEAVQQLRLQRGEIIVSRSKETRHYPVTVEEASASLVGTANN